MSPAHTMEDFSRLGELSDFAVAAHSDLVLREIYPDCPSARRISSSALRNEIVRTVCHSKPCAGSRRTKIYSRNALEVLANACPAHHLIGSRLGLECGTSPEDLHGANPTRHDHIPEDASPAATPARQHVKQSQMRFGGSRKPLNVENIARTGWFPIQSPEVKMQVACRGAKRASRPVCHFADCFQPQIAAAESQL